MQIFFIPVKKLLSLDRIQFVGIRIVRIQSSDIIILYIKWLFQPSEFRALDTIETTFSFLVPFNKNYNNKKNLSFFPVLFSIHPPCVAGPSAEPWEWNLWRSVGYSTCSRVQYVYSVQPGQKQLHFHRSLGEKMRPKGSLPVERRRFSLEFCMFSGFLLLPESNNILLLYGSKK